MTEADAQKAGYKAAQKLFATFKAKKAAAAGAAVAETRNKDHFSVLLGKKGGAGK